jgi:CRISPR/Cas system CSM-associated protein Csm3 (group 7 of RAMP superfamily)
MNFPVRVYTRITIEMTTPCNIGVGDESFHSDQPFVVDVNGLPTLPGSSLAGVLRAAFAAAIDDVDEVDRWFGHQNGDTARASRVKVTWGHVHDRHDVPVEGRLHPDDRSDFLNELILGEVRERVRLSKYGTADGHGKFDQQVVPSGTRFTFDLELVGNTGDADALEGMRDMLLRVMNRSTTRLGGSTHSGMGAFHIERAHSCTFKLHTPDDFRAYGQIPVRLDGSHDLDELSTTTYANEDADAVETIAINLELTPETFFVVAGGTPLQHEDTGKVADILPVRMKRVRWVRGDAHMGIPTLYLPGTSLKGALSHRLAFHYNRLGGCFADQNQNPQDRPKVGEQNAAVRELFGCVHHNGSSTNDDPGGRVGLVYIDDVTLEDYESTRYQMMHTSIDPFTSGVREHFLFDEEVLSPAGHTISIRLIIERVSTLSAKTRRALRLTLEDLADGRLTLGHGASRGNGHFRGEIQWHDDTFGEKLTSEMTHRTTKERTA